MFPYIIKYASLVPAADDTEGSWAAEPGWLLTPIAGLIKILYTYCGDRQMVRTCGKMGTAVDDEEDSNGIASLCRRRRRRDA